MYAGSDQCKADVALMLSQLLDAESALERAKGDCEDLDDGVNHCSAYVESTGPYIESAVELARKAVEDCDDVRDSKVCNEDLVYSFLGLYEAQASVLQSMKHCLAPTVA